MSLGQLTCFFIYVYWYRVSIGICYCQHTKMGSNNNDIPDGLSIVNKYVQIAINKLRLLK